MFLSLILSQRLPNLDVDYSFFVTFSFIIVALLSYFAAWDILVEAGFLFRCSYGMTSNPVFDIRFHLFDFLLPDVKSYGESFSYLQYNGYIVAAEKI